MAPPTDAMVPDVDNGASVTKSSWAVLHPEDPRLQVVNEAQEFTPLLLDYMKKKWNIADRGFDYNVVAVFGSQSTGKSTLLNKLFGTNFDVMNESARQQTTKGIWVSKARDANLLVMDVEGTDGRERGENQDFERKSALFSLAIAEVLIINMWENMVGLYNGANMGLLKTVFEVNLQLFQKHGSPKTCLFFVIRDFTGMTPVVNLSSTLVKDLERIWAGLVKPAGKEDCLIGDYFDFAFAALPHKIFAAEKFNAETDSLRSRFVNKANPDFAFLPHYHKHIPADGFPKFAESIWEKIVNNRDLDLPTQQQLLAQYRCDEIARVVYESFSEAIKGYRSQLEAGKVLESLGTETHEITETALRAFDQDGSRYHKEVYQKKRKDFVEKMDSALRVYYLQQLRNLHKRALAMFNEKLAEKLKGDDADFAGKLRDTRTEVEAYYRSVAEASKLPGSDWTGEEFYIQFHAELEEIAAQKKTEAMEKIVHGLEKTTSSRLSEPITVHLNDGNADMWKVVIDTFNETVIYAVEQLRKRLDGFESSEEEIATAVQSMKIKAWNVFQELLKKEVSDVQLIERLRHRFEGKFRYDENGLPRVWKPGDDIDGQFAKARDEVGSGTFGRLSCVDRTRLSLDVQADKLLVRFAKIDVSPSVIDPDIVQDEVQRGKFGCSETMVLTPNAGILSQAFTTDAFILLSPSKLQNLQERFRREADLLFVEAKRSIVTTTAKIPPWFVIMTVMLGWNEFLAVITNPLYFLMLGILAAGAYVTWYMGLTGPAFRVARATASEVSRQATQQLRSRGVDIEGIVDGSAFKDKRGVARLRRENNRSASSPEFSGLGSDGEAVEMTRRKRTQTVVDGQRRRDE
ncbi:Dynamin-like GTPase that mediates homotypic ER fusion [Borealophlyctis nickersoniae]|nr:Dynamin-like GTPase that mediates homotypic ER fusion [Borealophlyctis nickersoniae]